MRKILDMISIILFFALIGMFAVSTVMFGRLAGKKHGESFQSRLQRSAEQSFPLFENWRSVYTALITAAGQSRIGDIYVSDERMIEILSRTDEEKTARNIEEINRFAAAFPDASVYAMLVPTASGIYSADLPMVITATDQHKLIDDIYFSIDRSVVTLDAYNPLFSARDDYVYFRTDSSWTAVGAYAVYSKTVRKLGFTPLRLSNYDMEYAARDYYGGLYYRTYYGGTSADTIQLFRNKNGSFVTGVTALRDDEETEYSSYYYSPALKTDNKLDLYGGGDLFDRLTVRTSNEGAPKLLIIKGSYANMLVPFLTPHYSEITLLDPRALGRRSLEELVTVSDYDQVLFLFDTAEFSTEEIRLGVHPPEAPAEPE